MKKYLHKAWPYLKRWYVFVPLIIILIAGIAIAYSSATSGKDTEIITVEASGFTQEVAVTGKVVSAQDVSLGFETSGRIARVNVKVGDQVNQGQVLAYVSNGDASALVSQRQAIVESEQARLAELERGSRPEDIALAKADVDSATISISQAKQNLIDQIKDAYTKADDAIRTRIDQLYTSPTSANPTVIPFDTTNVGYSFKYQVEDERLRMGETMKNWNASIQTLTTTTYTADKLTEARNNLAQLRAFLNDISVVVTNLQPSSSVTQTTIDKYRTDIATARTNISQATSNLTTAQQSLESSQASLNRSQEQLNLKKAGSTQEQIDAQRAQVKSAQAQLQSAQASYSKTLITAPFTGVVTKVDTKAGEIASPNTPVISLISAAKYEMESYISETDIAKLKVGQTATVTLDAYGKETVFDALVTEVDPAETVLDGVSTYKTKIQFVNNDERIKSGMTANITITTDKREGVIVIPQQALSLKNGEKVVTVRTDKGDETRSVKTGSINTEGDIEVISGLQAGEQIVVKTK